ncbi:MAG: hypothetical protein ABSB94_03290 [Syntrophorhabdales bacterium]
MTRSISISFLERRLYSMPDRVDAGHPSGHRRVDGGIDEMWMRCEHR